MKKSTGAAQLSQTSHCDLVDALRQDWPEVSDVSMMLNSPWPEGCERRAGCGWALVLVGETVTKKCHPGRPCGWECAGGDADSGRVLCSRVRGPDAGRGGGVQVAGSAEQWFMVFEVFLSFDGSSS